MFLRSLTEERSSVSDITSDSPQSGHELLNPRASDFRTDDSLQHIDSIVDNSQGDSTLFCCMTGLNEKAGSRR